MVILIFDLQKSLPYAKHCNKQVYDDLIQDDPRLPDYLMKISCINRRRVQFLFLGKIKYLIQLFLEIFSFFHQSYSLLLYRTNEHKRSVMRYPQRVNNQRGENQMTDREKVYTKVNKRRKK